MSALRTSGLWVRVAAALALPVGFLGCGTPPPPGPPPSPQEVGSYDPAWIAHRPELPAPEADRIAYDDRTRTLSLYSLPGNGRWMVQMPGERDGRIVSPRHQISEAETSEVMVFYVQPGRRPSTPVSVKQIQESGSPHVSLR